MCKCKLNKNKDRHTLYPNDSLVIWVLVGSSKLKVAGVRDAYVSSPLAVLILVSLSLCIPMLVVIHVR